MFTRGNPLLISSDCIFIVSYISKFQILNDTILGSGGGDIPVVCTSGQQLGCPRPYFIVTELRGLVHISQSII